MQKLIIRKAFLVLFSIFFFIYSILGIILNQVDISFLFLSLLYFISSALLFNHFFNSDLRIAGRQNFIKTIDNIASHKQKIIIIYFLFYLALFIYPNMRLGSIINPTFDFQAYFQDRFSEGNVISTLIDRLRQLIYPLFLIALSRVKFRNAILLLLFNLYLGFANSGYIGRGSLVILFITIMYALSLHNKKLFKKLLFLGIIASPIVLWGFVQYTRIRLGASQMDISFMDSVKFIFVAESRTSYYGEIAYNNNNSSYLFAYLRWLFTLPIPGQLLPFAPFQLNYEIAKDIHGMLPGQKGFTVTLIGLFFESMYAFGNKLFLLHAIVLQYTIAFLLKIVANIKGSVFLIGAILAQATYVLNRGGSAGFYPFAINTMLLIIIIYILSLILKKTFVFSKK